MHGSRYVAAARARRHPRASPRGSSRRAEPRGSGRASYWGLALIPFPAAVLGFVVAALGTALAGGFWKRRLGGTRWIATSRADRHPHRPTSKAGGPAFLTGLLLAVLSFAFAFPRIGAAAIDLAGTRAILAALVIVVLFGAIGALDDRGGIGPGPKLVASGAALLIGWICLRGPTGALANAEGEPVRFAVAFAAALAIQIALSVFDNLDGVVASTTAAAFGSWGARESDPLRPVHCAAAGASAGFLFWNHPPARLFLGNLGSSVIAGLVSLVVLEQAMSGSQALLRVLLPVAWPLVDLVFVTVRRLGGGQPPWRGGRDHTTHELARRIGVRWVWLLALVVATLGAWGARLL